LQPVKLVVKLLGFLFLFGFNSRKLLMLFVVICVWHLFQVFVQSVLMITMPNLTLVFVEVLFWDIGQVRKVAGWSLVPVS